MSTSNEEEDANVVDNPELLTNDQNVANGLSGTAGNINANDTDSNNASSRSNVPSKSPALLTIIEEELPDLSSENANDANTTRFVITSSSELSPSSQANSIPNNEEPNQPSTSSSLGGLGLPQLDYNPNNRNELDNLSSRNNLSNDFSGDLLNVHLASAYNDNGQISSEFMKFRNNIINTLITEGKIRIHTPRDTNRRATRRTLDDFLLNDDDFADFNIGGIPIKWTGLDNPEFLANVNTTTPFVNRQLAQLEEWARSLNEIIESTMATKRWILNRLEEVIAENTPLGDDSDQELRDINNSLGIYENLYSDTNISPNEATEESVLNRRFSDLEGVSNSNSNDATIIEDTTVISSSFLPRDMNNLDASDSSLSTVANLTNREDEVNASSSQPRPASSSSPLSWNHVSVEKYFASVPDLDITLEEDTNNSTQQISEINILDQRINELEISSFLSSSKVDDLRLASSPQDISLGVQEIDNVPNSRDINDALENSIADSTSHTLFASLDDSMGASPSPKFSDSLEDTTVDTASDSFYDSLEDVTIPLAFSLGNSDSMSDESEQTNSTDTKESPADETTRDLSSQ